MEFEAFIKEMPFLQRRIIHKAWERGAHVSALELTKMPHTLGPRNAGDNALVIHYC